MSMDADPQLPIDSDVELAERPAPHPWVVLRAQVHLVPVIAVGGALGSLARWGFAQAVPRASGSFAWATFWTNASGALLLGLLMAFMLSIWSHTRFVRPFLGVGVLGGYTTFSTYLLDTRAMLAADRPLLALAYLVGTIALGLLAVVVGVALGRTLIALAPIGDRA